MPCHTELSSRLLSSCRRRAAAWFVLLAPEKNIYFFCCPLAFFFFGIGFRYGTCAPFIGRTNQSIGSAPPSVIGRRERNHWSFPVESSESEPRKEGRKEEPSCKSESEPWAAILLGFLNSPSTSTYSTLARTDVY